MSDKRPDFAASARALFPDNPIDAEYVALLASNAYDAGRESMREELRFCDAEKQSARRVSRQMIQQRDEAVGLLSEFAYRTAETDLGLEDRAKAFLAWLAKP